MYCYHCGYQLDEKKVEKKKSSFALDAEIKEDTTVSYICPRCGHLITSNMQEEDRKALSRASHAQIQRGNNTVIIVTHNALIADIADVVIRVKNGKIKSVEENANPANIDEVQW